MIFWLKLNVTIYSLLTSRNMKALFTQQYSIVTPGCAMNTVCQTISVIIKLVMNIFMNQSYSTHPIDALSLSLSTC